MPNLTFRTAALEILGQDDPDQALFAFVRWLDLEMHAKGERMLVAEEIFLQALVALGDLLLEGSSPSAAGNIRATVEAAENALREPSDTRRQALGQAATASYPFGPGDGCYSVPETGVEGCEPGSGCRTGAGSLACQGLPARQVVAHLRHALRLTSAG